MAQVDAKTEAIAVLAHEGQLQAILKQTSYQRPHTHGMNGQDSPLHELRGKKNSCRNQGHVEKRWSQCGDEKVIEGGQNRHAYGSQGNQHQKG